MKNEEVLLKPVKEAGEKANHDFHLRLSKKEKERFVMLTKAANYATMSQFLKDQLFRPDLHYKLDLILNLLKNKSEGSENEAVGSRKIPKQKS
jgi:hypothetical protein